MAELLFIATTIFVAYVVFVVIGKRDKPETHQSAAKPVTVAPAVQPEKAPIPPASEIIVSAKPVAKTPAAKTKATPAKKPAKSAPSNPASDSLKNPKTGEVAKLPGNYAFAKRWIKEALVEEGLLDKIYKNNELDSTVTAKIQDALQQLKAMDKYQ